MDVSYTNVLEGARQYFQGLPMPSTAITPTKNRIHDEQTSNSSTVDDGRQTNSNNINKIYWNTSNNELRTIEPYPPQPTRVEVPDTRPNNDDDDNNDDNNKRSEYLENHKNLTNLTEMQSTNRTNKLNQQRDLLNTHSPSPIYQQLNNVSGPSSYNRPIEINNTTTNSSYTTNDRTTSTPVIPHRTQYYPRYHHPDITKSSPLPFSRNSNVYQASVSPSIDSQPQPPRQLINIDLENKRIQDQQQQQLPPSSVYQMTSSETTASPTVAYRQSSSSSSSDSSSIHSSTNPCNPCHVQKIHIPSHNNHQGYIPSPHLPVSSVAPQSSIAHPSSQLSHLPNRINPTNNNNNINNQNRVGLSSSSHYQNQHHHASKQQQQQSMLPPSMCNNQLSISSHESNRNLNSPSRQSPHASILHNPIASQGLIDAQPHSPPYPPPPHSPPRVSSHHSMHSSSSSSSSSSTTYGSHNAHSSSSYPQNSYQTNIYHSTTKINNQYPVNDLQSSSSSTLNSTTSVYSRQHASPLKQNNNYNIIDSKQIAGISNANQGNTSSSVYVASSGIQRSINTHNLPINDNSSGHLNRSNRDIQIKNQSISQLSNNNMTSSSSSYVLAPRTREHSHERISNAINAETYYPPYKSSEYRDYKTTNASSHYSCTSSTSTTVMSVSNDTRPSAPSSITVPLRPVLDTNNRRLIYPQQQQQHRRGGDDYSSTDYLYNNSNSTNQQSQSQPTSRVVSPQPFIVNGPVIKKRESPLDLSVKTIKTTADSTARDDIDTFDKTNNLRKNIMPLLSTHQGPVVYANYDNRQLNGSRYSTPNLRPTTPQVPVCAPKVDFLPNFNSTPLRHQNNTDNNLRRSTPNILPTQAQTNNLQSLPNMSTFKKTLLPTTATTTTTTTTSSSSSSQPGTNNYVLPERVKLPLKYPTVEPRQQQRLQDYDNNDRYSESHNKYITNRGSVKRLGGPYIPGGIGPNKHPRVDVWKEVFDKQIQDKLTAALAQREKQQKQNLEKNLPKTVANGTLVSSIYQNTNTNNNNNLQQQNTENSSFHSQSINQYQRMNINEERYKDINNCRDTNVYPIIKSPNLASGLHTSSQSSYSHQSNSRSPHPQQQQQQQPPQHQQHQQQWQSFHDLPSNTGADKRVLTLLRNSLENKQQREEQHNNKQSIYSNKIITPVEPKTNIGRHNLSPFAAASLLERNSNTSPHHKFHVPRTIDSITQEMSRSPYGSRIINSASLPIGKEADINNRNIELQRDNKDDNLAAILAAKIRTKAELKQVVSGQYNCSKTISLLSSSSSSSLQDIGDSERAASTSTPQSAASSAGSPPKLTREKTPSILPRRRLFSKSEDDNNTTLMSSTTATTTTSSSSTKAAPIVSQFTVPTRSSDFRSSSETSVFDFRESDSEGEMPVLERQTLEEMRRDRKQLSKVQPAVSFNDAMSVNMVTSNDLVKIELKENNQVNKNDPFWSETCDKFMEQLRSGGSSGSSGGSGDSAKKRGRRKKIINTNNIKTEIIIKPENIKKEINEKIEIEINNDIKLELIKNTDDNDVDNNEIIIKNEITNDINDDCNNSDHDSDELPLIKRASRRRIKKEINDSDADDDIISKKRRGSRIKLESSSGSESSSDDSDASGEPGLGSSVAHRLRTRKRSGITTIIDNEGMKLRSREMLPQKIKQQQQQQSKETKETKETKDTKTPIKNTIIQKPKPKPLFGDGSDFRPGWEEEVYVYKKSLRMPTQLINVSRPSRFHRLSTSLPDLDPDSPALSVSMDSTDVCLEKRGGSGVNSSGISAIGRVADSDIDSNCSLPNNDDEGTSTPIITTTKTTTNLSKSIIKFDGNSIVDVLAKKVGSNKKDIRKKLKDKFEKNSIKILPKGSNEPELLSTPSFTKIINETKLSTTNGKTQIKNNSNNINNNNNSNNNKFKKSVNMVDSLLGYFRKETVNNFRDTFKNNHALPNEFSTYVLKSRTRTETKVLKKQATIREVFGEDRPASAPPMQNHAGDTSQDDDDSQTETKEILKNKNNSRTLRQKVVSRLRNVGIIRSHKSIINSKRHLLTVQRRKVILKSMTDKKLKNSINTKTNINNENNDNDDIEDEDEDEDNNKDDDNEDNINNDKIKKEQDTDINDDTEIVGKKKIKLRNGRKKFRSGFDYIRKKKKPIKKDDNNIPKERKKQMNLRTNAECVADLQNEIRTWVIKKGVGETILHRAARLGYTDVAAYCLEKLNNAPSPKDNAGYTPLHEACSRGHLEIAKLLLAYGANVSESANGGIRPLHEAAENGATELVRLLLSYGADPLLATYAGHTPLMLAVDTDAYTILEQHLGDVQGRSTTPWKFYGPSSIFDPEESGYNPMKEPPVSSPEPELDDIEFEMSDINLPVLFSLANDPDKWILLSDLMSALRIKSRDALLRQINPKAPAGPPTIAHRDVMKELKLPDFLDQSRCCHLLSAGEKINVRASKVALIKYNEQVKSLLNVESVFINLS